MFSFRRQPKTVAIWLKQKNLKCFNPQANGSGNLLNKICMKREFTKHLADALYQFFETRRDEILKLTRALVEAESPSGDLEGSRAVVSLLAQAARKIGAVTSVERIESPGYGEHLRVEAFAGAGDESETILIIGHTDTVHPRGSLLERPWREQDGRIYGPGVFDMKANCALALEVVGASQALDLAPQHPLVL